MGKNKLERFAEMETFPNVIQPALKEVLNQNHPLKGKWRKEVFKNDHPLVLELGCGKGEYTIGLAEKFNNKNFIGVDIKGARMWKGAKYAVENQISNAFFLRTRIEMINSFFAKDEVDEIWVTFPDPQLKKRRAKKRLTSSGFLNNYRQFLKKDGVVHLKTDNLPLHEYTRKLVEFNNLQVLADTGDLYHSNLANDILSIKTFYEQQFLDQGLTIKYLKFCPGIDNPIIELPEDEE